MIFDMLCLRFTESIQVKTPINLSIKYFKIDANGLSMQEI